MRDSVKIYVYSLPQNFSALKLSLYMVYLLASGIGECAFVD